MNRLTYKLDEPIKIKNLNYEYNKNSKYLVKISNDMIFNKLGKLEDIEEQLGCPLDVLVKILLYPKIRTRFGIREIDKIDYYVEDDNRGLMIYFKNGTFDKVSNYKKTWWLKEDRSE